MKIYKIILLTIVSIMLTISCISANSNDIIYNYPDEKITVIFQADTTLSIERQKQIAESIINPNKEKNTQTRSLCWLIGHEIVTEVVETIEHKVTLHSPRCLSKQHMVETCSRCDYINMAQISSSLIVCCPDD